jgi:hypothetical protein
MSFNVIPLINNISNMYENRPIQIEANKFMGRKAYRTPTIPIVERIGFMEMRMRFVRVIFLCA